MKRKSKLKKKSQITGTMSKLEENNEYSDMINSNKKKTTTITKGESKNMSIN